MRACVGKAVLVLLDEQAQDVVVDDGHVSVDAEVVVAGGVLLTRLPAHTHARTHTHKQKRVQGLLFLETYMVQ